ncbi:uncharacterized protein LOC121235605 [Juglans microcarpa x Juglans regia]|uniref:uncharacterized protein LOC121235605 n=1 Tax=Juglans microcarpa x Juglans regia TaxID=2249226 RepID=UPI001B7DA750|nr:uncharacterized protein LOC121235605 [Juglans microcarpa x Juglans regia]
MVLDLVVHDYSYSLPQTCALKVDINYSGWHKTMLKVLKKIIGIPYDIDVNEGMAYVSGKVDPHTILKKLV